MIKVVKGYVNKEDIDLVNNYLISAKFNTREEHSPLHNNLFENNGSNFSITTYGDMGKDISHVFNKICECIKSNVSELTGKDYGPPILTKSYIMAFNQKELPMSFDPGRPQDVFRSLVFWNKDIPNITVSLDNQDIKETLEPGDIIIFPETQEFSRTAINDTDFPIYVSDFWNAPSGQSPYTGLKYEDVAWGNPMYDKID